MEGSSILILVARQHPSLISSTKVSPERERERDQQKKEGVTGKTTKGCKRFHCLVLEKALGGKGGQQCESAKKRHPCILGYLLDLQSVSLKNTQTKSPDIPKAKSKNWCDVISNKIRPKHIWSLF